MARSADPSSEHIAAAQDRLGHLAGLANKTHHAERKILDAAEKRRASIDADLVKLVSRVYTDPAASDQYQAMVLERGRLDVIAAQSRNILSPASE